MITFPTGDTMLPFIPSLASKHNQRPSFQANFHFSLLMLKDHESIRSKTQANNTILEQINIVNMRIDALTWLILIDNKLVKFYYFQINLSIQSL